MVFTATAKSPLFQLLVSGTVALAWRCLLKLTAVQDGPQELSRTPRALLQDGLFMIVFSEPRSAVEWAVLLQLALFR